MPNVPKKLTLVAIENYHEIITEYIKDNEILISEYDDMTECVLKMIREGYCFNMDKNLLRGFLEDLTYMFSPNDDKNKDRIVNMLEESDDSDSESESGDSNENMENIMMNMLMQGMKGKGTNESKDSTEEKTSEITEVADTEVADTEVADTEVADTEVAEVADTEVVEVN